MDRDETKEFTDTFSPYTEATGETRGITGNMPTRRKPKFVGTATFNLPEIGKVNVPVMKKGTDASTNTYYYNDKKMGYNDLMNAIYRPKGYSEQEIYDLLSSVVE